MNLTKKKTAYFIIFLLPFLACKSSKPIVATENPDFRKIAYQNDDLVVDLGVGLWAWPLPMDFDKDGDMDLIVSCPDKPSNGTYFFENKSKKTDKEVVFEKGRKIAKGFKNLQVSNVNGQAKVLGPGIEYLNFETEFFNNPKIIFDNKSLEKNHKKIRFSQWKYVDFDGDGDQDLLAGIDDWSDYGWDNAFDKEGNWTNGPLRGVVYYLENLNGKYENRGKILANNKPINVYGAPSPNMYDFDGDGDLDLICGEFLDRLTWFENVGSRSKPVFAEGRFLSNASGLIKMDLEMIIPTAVDWDKDGDIDLIIGDEDGRVALVENTGTVKDRMPQFESPKYFQQKAEHIKFGALVTPFAVDWDDDGDDDLICGNSAGYIGFVENLNGTWAKPAYLEVNNEPIRYLAGEKGSIQGPAEAKWGYTTLSVADWNGDGLKDVLVNSIWGTITWHRNIGQIGKPKLAESQPVIMDWANMEVPKPKWNWWNPKSTELATQWRTTPNAIDWNKDGLMDLVMLDHEGYLAYFERFEQDGILKLMPGNRIFKGVNGSGFTNRNDVKVNKTGPLRLNVGEAGGSGRRKWCFVDWDEDGDLDLLVNGLNVVLFENLGTENGLVQLAFRGDISSQRLAGHTTSPTMINLNKDGKPSLLVGAEDGFMYLFER
ncbi:VCBS repeat-containing protein [uncultured Arcticibacterium sp.]|uniref:VCBS repeat-containing protein n=1 Tax=uncultured Arcticibacterium sp. TaxID=2173042 RepID=UPI0030F8AC4A